MKQFDVACERRLSGNVFFIRPFPAFVSANLSGEVTALIIPVLGSILPVIGGASGSDEDSLFDMDVEKAAPALAGALSGVNGDKIESLLKKLLVKHGNISVELDGEHEVQKLTEDLANEIFCGDAQDMFILAFDVIKANFSGFFTKIQSLFGDRIGGLLQRVQTSSEGTES